MTNSGQLTRNENLLHNMSVPSKTTITFQGKVERVYGHGVIIVLPHGLSRSTPGQLLKLLQNPPKGRPDLILKRLIETRARELPLPPVVAISSQMPFGDTTSEDLLTIVTILAKSSSRVYLRDKTPNLASIAAGRRLVLVVPKEIRL